MHDAHEVIALAKAILPLCGGDDTQWINWALRYKGQAKGALAIAWRAEGFGDGILSALGVSLMDGLPMAEFDWRYLLARAKEEAARAAATRVPDLRHHHVAAGHRMLDYAIAKKASRAKVKLPSPTAAAAIKLLPRG